MKEDGEYATDKPRRRERIASIAVVGLSMAGIFLAYGLPVALRYGVGSLLPLACIWFPGAMSYFKGPAPGRDFYVREPSHPGILRIAAWFLIGSAPLFLILYRLLGD